MVGRMIGSEPDIVALAAGADDSVTQWQSDNRENAAAPLGRLFVETYRDLTSFFLRRTRNGADAEDLTQETYLRFQRAGYEADSEEAKSRLFHIARNLFVDHARRDATHRRNGFGAHANLDGDTAMVAQDTPSPETAVSDRQRLEEAIAIINRLPPRCREVFIMSRFHGLAHKAIAARLGISCSAVEKHLARALAETTAVLFPESRASGERGKEAKNRT